MSKLGYAVGRLAPGIAKISEIDPYEAMDRRHSYMKKQYELEAMEGKRAQDARDAQMEERGQVIGEAKKLYFPGAGDALKFARDILKKNPYMTVGDAIQIGRDMAEREDDEKRLAAAIQYGKWTNNPMNKTYGGHQPANVLAEKMFGPAMRKGGAPKKFDIRQAVMKARRPF